MPINPLLQETGIDRLFKKKLHEDGVQEGGVMGHTVLRHFAPGSPLQGAALAVGPLDPLLASCFPRVERSEQGLSIRLT